jgi:hypothetical protein
LIACPTTGDNEEMFSYLQKLRPKIRLAYTSFV